MGVDCMIFATRGKKCVYLDRHRNIGYVDRWRFENGHWWRGWTEGLDKAVQNGIESREEMDEYIRHAGLAYRDKVRLLTVMCGFDDVYFVVTDNSEPSFRDVKIAGGFNQVLD